MSRGTGRIESGQFPDALRPRQGLVETQISGRSPEALPVRLEQSDMLIVIRIKKDYITVINNSN